VASELSIDLTWFRFRNTFCS